MLEDKLRNTILVCAPIFRLAAGLAFCIGAVLVAAQTTQHSKVTFDDVVGQSQPKHVSFYTGETWGTTTPEGGSFGVFNGTFYTACSCVPGDGTTAYGSIAGFTSAGFGASIGPAPTSAVTFKLINGGATAATFDIGYSYFKHVNFDPFVFQLTGDMFTDSIPPGAAIQVKLPLNDVYGFTVKPTAETYNRGSWAFFIDDVEWDFVPSAPPAEYRITAHLTNPLTLPEQKTLPASMKVPLGARFAVGMQKLSSPPQDVTAHFDLGSATLENAQSDPTLYPSSALLEFDPKASAVSKEFQAIHMGTQPIVITPDDASAKTQVIQVTVVAPASLGTTHKTITFSGDSFDLDAKIIEWADKRGIPPQLIKGIIDRESGSKFTPLEWRYEPLTTDWDEFSAAPRGGNQAPGKNQRALPLYAPYRMEYDADHPRGWLLVDDEDVHPRSAFYSDFNAKMHFADSDQFVTAYDIVIQNESWQNWIKILGNPSKKALLATSAQTALAWPANTTLASSYGLMQVLFSESFDNYGYAGIGGQRRPYYLFDVPSNVVHGAGSIPVGTGVYVVKFRRRNGYEASGEFSPSYLNADKLDVEYKRGLFGYNGESCDYVTAQYQCYGPDTMNRMKKYPPIPADPILH